MNNECKKNKEKIEGLISGILSDSEAEILQMHLDECKECNEYANALKSEDKLLTELFTQIDSDTQNRLDKVLQVINNREQKEKVSIEKFKPLVKLAAAAAIIIIVLFGIEKFGSPSIAWADVVEKFKSVKCFNAVMYWKENLTSEPIEIELWRNRNGKIRLLSGKQVMFAENAKVIKAFDIQNRREAKANEQATYFIDELGSLEEFSLQSVINSIAGNNLEDITPKINSDEIISHDIVVFDIEYSDLEWFRIWALKESKLPIRIKSWTPRDGGSIDIVFSYSKEQSHEFFDPNAFTEALKNKYLTEINLAYMFLKDPVHKKISPVIIDEKKAFGIVTQTLDGETWSLADYKGKAVLITFWSEWMNSLEKYKEIYDKYGKRNDFIMVGVNLDPSADNAKQYCEKEGIEWQQLHEEIKPWKNSNGMIISEPQNKLAEALGITYTLGVVLVKKDGTITKITNTPLLDDCVRALIEDIEFYPSQEWINNMVIGKAENKNDIERMFGKPLLEEITYDEVTKNDDYERWNYEVFLEDQSRIVTLYFSFNKTGKILFVGNKT